MIDDPPEWLEDWGRQVGAKLEDGLREGPSFIAFARENGSVYHTYTVMAPDRSSRRTTRSCSSARRSPSPRSPAPGARTSTRTDRAGAGYACAVRKRASAST